jgi:uncharacterized paraquat-inducible protein A
MRVKNKYVYDANMYHENFKEESQNKYIDRVREDLKLSPIKKGERSCLRCDSVFFSNDLNNQKTCVRCRGKNV